jgi:hypothetical protein
VSCTVACFTRLLTYHQSHPGQEVQPARLNIPSSTRTFAPRGPLLRLFVGLSFCIYNHVGTIGDHERWSATMAFRWHGVLQHKSTVDYVFGAETMFEGRPEFPRKVHLDGHDRKGVNVLAVGNERKSANPGASPDDRYPCSILAHSGASPATSPLLPNAAFSRYVCWWCYISKESKENLGTRSDEVRCRSK